MHSGESQSYFMDGFSDEEDEVEIIEVKAEPSVTPPAKRRGRPPVRTESDVGPICDSLCRNFLVKFVPTRVKTITREMIYEHFTPLCDSLAVAKCFNKFGRDLDRTPFFFKIFIRTKEDTEEMVRYNRQSAVVSGRKPRWSNKLHKKTVKSYFESLNVWPEETAHLDRDDDNVRHHNFVMFINTETDNLRNMLKKVSDSDGDLLYFGIDEDGFEDYWKEVNWSKTLIRSNQEFHISDPFVSQSRKSADFLRKFFNDYKLRHRLKETLKPVQLSEPFRDWRDDVCKWWNRWLDEGWYEKRKQLFLWGASDAGKSTFVNTYLLQDLKSESIFTPIYTTESSTSRFTWASFDERVHCVVMWDEFDPNTVDVNSFKLCTEGADFSSDVKYEDAKRIHVRMPQIYISQVSLEEHIARGERKGRNFEGFRTRLFVVEAKDTNMDIETLNAYRATIGKHALPDLDRRLIGPEQLANTESSSSTTTEPAQISSNADRQQTEVNGNTDDTAENVETRVENEEDTDLNQLELTPPPSTSVEEEISQVVDHLIDVITLSSTIDKSTSNSFMPTPLNLLQQIDI